MSKKSFLFLLFIIIIIFTTHNYLNPPGKDFEYPQNQDYDLKTKNINKNNTSSVFKAEGNGKFFIHTGEKNPSVGIFTFNKEGIYIFTFSIRESGKYGDIEPIIHKSIIYHIEEITSLSDPDFMQKIKNKKIYLDKKVDTIVIPYKSIFY